MGRRFGNAKQPFETIPEKIQDPATREAIDRIQQFLAGTLFGRFDGDHFEVSITRNTVGQTTFQYAHNFKFMPKDIWITYQDAEEAKWVTIDYLGIDATNLSFNIGNMDVGDTQIVRFFAGSFSDSPT
jgi:hypothetical protein